MNDLNSARPSDETLVAYADGQLDPAEAKKVEEYLERDPETRHLVDLMRTSGKLANAALDSGTFTSPADQRLAEMIRNHQPAGAAAKDAAAKDNVVAFPPKRVPIPSLPPYGLSIAASVALILAGLGGYQIGRNAPSSEPSLIAVGPVTTNSAIAVLLEEKATGDHITVPSASDNPHEYAVIASFRDAAGRVCREFELLNPDETPEAAAIACRSKSDQWVVEGVVRTAISQTKDGDTFNPASGNTHSPIESLLKSMGASPALSKAEEEALSKAGWR